MYIYVDILIITNIYANYFLLKATSKLTHSPLSNKRCIISSITGSLFSLIILLPALNTLSLLILRITAAILMVFIAFKEKNTADLYKTGLIFFFVCCLFAGTEYAFSLLDMGKNLLWHNSVLYVNISLLTLAVSTITAYCILCLLRRFLDSGNTFDGNYTLIIIHGNKQATIKAACDSGNNLTDSFSGKPVIVCGKSSIAPLFEEKALQYSVTGTDLFEMPTKKGWRVIPFSTVNSSGLMPSFLPTGIYLKNNETGKIKYIEAYIGIAEKDIEYAVFSPKLLN
ncbi:MAG: sigma-E processing peptidase SpoIIGA [Oscillospiraceae bacterium]|nr:sigma-E processing peptidase SpoIIGA [Oscillospiraceae bacterium]